MKKRKKHIPIGIDDFKELIEEYYYFADKTLFIKELLDSKAKVTLITRPRRFGKTLNLSMVRYFFEKILASASPQSDAVDLRRALFAGLAIEQHADCMKHQGKYPVIWLTLKDVKTDAWDSCYDKICRVIASEFKRHFEALQPWLSELESGQIAEIIAGTASQAQYENALLDLSFYLERAYQSKVIILIDEYDAPVYAGYFNGYYNEVVNFLRGFLGAGLKGNISLNFGLLSGILRVAKESIFSGINNLEVCTLLRKDYDDKFGFLENEVADLFSYFDLQNRHDEVRQWYDGYRSGNYLVYNPWSIINLIKNRGQIEPYWVNTSDNALITDRLKKSSSMMKEELEILVTGGKIKKPIQENITMPDIDSSEGALWEFLLFCGYLTFENYRREGRSFFAELSLPNEEVATVYETSFKQWFLDRSTMRDYTKMLENLVAGQPIYFKQMFERFSRETLSYFDVRGNEPEQFYHALVLGMLASLVQTHEVRSNRESGYGRYDVMIIPKDHQKSGIIIEFKNVEIQTHETLEMAAKNALKQIEERQYETELRARGIKTVLKFGIAFQGKESLVLMG